MNSRVLAALAYVALYVAIGAEAPYLVLYFRSFGLELWAVGAIAAMAGAIALVAGPIWGSASDRARGAPVVLLGATLVAAAGAVTLGLASGPPTVVGGMALLSIGLAGISPIVDARVLEMTPDRSGYGPLRAWGSIAYVAGAGGTGVAIDIWGIRVAMLILVVALLTTGAVGLTLRPAAKAAAERPLRSAARLFGRSGLGPFLVGAFLTWMAMSAVGAYYPVRLSELGAPASTIGIAASLGAAVEVPIMLAFPAVIARIGAGRIIVLGAAVFVTRAVIAAVTTDPMVLVVASGINGIGFACFVVGGITYVSRRAPAELAATAQSVFQGFGMGLGQIVASAGGGALAGALTLPGLFVVSAAIGSAATGIVAVAVRRDPARRPSTAPSI